MKRILSAFLLILFTLPLTVSAQDATATPPAEDIPTLESVTADPALYYGQEVAFEGVVAELVNTRSFVLGEGAAIDDDQVLVLNNSGQEFNIGLTRDARVLVTGVIYPAFDQGGWDQLAQELNALMISEPVTEMQITPTLETMTEGDMTEEAAMSEGEMMATEEADMSVEMEATEEVSLTEIPAAIGTDMMTGVTLLDYPTIVIQDRFPSYTLLVVDSIENITFVETEAAP